MNVSSSLFGTSVQRKLRRHLTIFLIAFFLAGILVSAAYMTSGNPTDTLSGTTEVHFSAGSLYLPSSMSWYLPSYINYATYTTQLNITGIGFDNLTISPAAGYFNLTLASYLPNTDSLSLAGGNGTSVTVVPSWHTLSTIAPSSVAGPLTSFTTSGYDAGTSLYSYSEVASGTVTSAFFIPSSFPNSGVPQYVQIGSTPYTIPGTSPGFSYVSVSGGIAVTVIDTIGTSSIVIGMTPYSGGSSVPPGGPPGGTTCGPGTQLVGGVCIPIQIIPSGSNGTTTTVSIIPQLNIGINYLVALVIAFVGLVSILAVRRSEAEESTKFGLSVVLTFAAIWGFFEVIFASHTISYGAFGVGVSKLLLLLFPPIQTGLNLSIFANAYFDSFLLIVAGISALIISQVRAKRAS